jgi:hypothetical protein
MTDECRQPFFNFKKELQELYNWYESDYLPNVRDRYVSMIQFNYEDEQVHIENLTISKNDLADYMKNRFI